MRLFILLVVIISLQIFLSTRENKWFGFILPILCFLFAVFVVPLNTLAPATGIDMSYIFTLIVAFVLYNIPTMIFMAIYYVCRRIKEKKIVQQGE